MAKRGSSTWATSAALPPREWPMTPTFVLSTSGSVSR